jgi:hypothetical protein
MEAQSLKRDAHRMHANICKIDIGSWLLNCSNHSPPPQHRETLKWYMGDSEFTWEEESDNESRVAESHATPSPPRSKSPPTKGKKPALKRFSNTTKQAVSSEEYYASVEENGEDEQTESDESRGRPETQLTRIAKRPIQSNKPASHSAKREKCLMQTSMDTSEDQVA